MLNVMKLNFNEISVKIHVLRVFNMNCSDLILIIEVFGLLFSLVKSTFPL